MTLMTNSRASVELKRFFELGKDRGVCRMEDDGSYSLQQHGDELSKRFLKALKMNVRNIEQHQDLKNEDKVLGAEVIKSLAKFVPIWRMAPMAPPFFPSDASCELSAWKLVQNSHDYASAEEREVIDQACEEFGQSFEARLAGLQAGYFPAA